MNFTHYVSPTIIPISPEAKMAVGRIFSSGVPNRYIINYQG